MQLRYATTSKGRIILALGLLSSGCLTDFPESGTTSRAWPVSPSDAQSPDGRAPQPPAFEPLDALSPGAADLGGVDAADLGSVDARPTDSGPLDAGPIDLGPVDAGPVCPTPQLPESATLVGCPEPLEGRCTYIFDLRAAEAMTSCATLCEAVGLDCLEAHASRALLVCAGVQRTGQVACGEPLPLGACVCVRP